MIPGMFPAGAAGVGAVLTTLTVVDTAYQPFTFGPNDITIPTVQTGDMLFYYGVVSGSDPTVSTPSGWTLVSAWRPVGSPYTFHAVTLCKIASSSDSGGSVNIGSNFNTTMRLLVVVRGDRPIVALNIGSKNTEFNNGILGAQPSPQTVAMSGVQAPAMVFGTYTRQGAAVAARIFTIGGVGVKDGEYTIPIGTGADQQWIAWKAFNIGGAAIADVVVDMNDTGNNMFLSSCYIACT